MSTMELSDSLRPCVTVVSLRFPMRALRRWARPGAGPPESRTRCCHACQGSATPPGAGTPCRSGVPAVAFRVFGARRHPDWPFRGSIPCLHVPLSTLHRPRYQSLRMTRGQRGWLDLRCQRLALFHTVPVCPGTPERWRSPAAGSRSDVGAEQLSWLSRVPGLFFRFAPPGVARVVRYFSRALRMVNSLCIHAVKATFLTFPAARSRS